MIGKESEAESMASLPEVLDILEERKKGKELTYEQQLAYDHAKKFAGLDKSKADKIKKSLQELGMGEKTAIRLIDVMPKSPMTVKQILAHENKVFNDEEIAKILALLKEK